VDHFPEAVHKIVRHIELNPSQPTQHLLLLNDDEGGQTRVLLTVLPEQRPMGKEARFTGLIVPLVTDLE